MQNDPSESRTEGATAPDLTETARHEWDDAKQRLAGAADKVRDEASHAGSTAAGLIMRELDKRRGDLGQSLRQVTDAMRRAAEKSDAPSRVVNQTAHLMENAATTLEQTSVSDMGRRLGEYGRSNAALFIGGCILTGLLAGRLLASDSSGQGGMASSSSGRDDSGRDRNAGSGSDYGSGAYRSSGYGSDGASGSAATGAQDFTRDRAGSGSDSFAGSPASAAQPASNASWDTSPSGQATGGTDTPGKRDTSRRKSGLIDDPVSSAEDRDGTL